MNQFGPGDERTDVRSAFATRGGGSRSDPAGLDEETPRSSDAALVGLVGKGDAGALDELYGRYGRACFSLARRILTDVTLAQDVVQEVFLAIWREPGRYDTARGGFSTWLMSMTHHKAVDVVRREENLRKRAAAAEAVEAARPPREGPDEAAWATVRRERVRAALATLPAAQREALGLAYYGGYTQREVAGLTNTPLGTVKTRMLAGMRKLRDTLEIVLDEGDACGPDSGVSPA